MARREGATFRDVGLCVCPIWQPSLTIWTGLRVLFPDHSSGDSSSCFPLPEWTLWSARYCNGGARCSRCRDLGRLRCNARSFVSRVVHRRMEKRMPTRSLKFQPCWLGQLRHATPTCPRIEPFEGAVVSRVRCNFGAMNGQCQDPQWPRRHRTLRWQSCASETTT